MARVYGIDPHGIYSKVPISNYEIYTGVADVYWTDTTHYVAEVPAGKVWWLWGGYVDIENNSTVDVTIKDASDNILMLLLDEAAGTASFGFPDPALHTCQMPIPLLAGWYIEIVFGAAQSTAAFACAVTTAVDAIA